MFTNRTDTTGASRPELRPGRCNFQYHRLWYLWCLHLPYLSNKTRAAQIIAVNESDRRHNNQCNAVVLVVCVCGAPTTALINNGCQQPALLPTALDRPYIKHCSHHSRLYRTDEAVIFNLYHHSSAWAYMCIDRIVGRPVDVAAWRPRPAKLNQKVTGDLATLRVLSLPRRPRRAALSNWLRSESETEDPSKTYFTVTIKLATFRSASTVSVELALFTRLPFL
ncbi:hypothetical protein J6590_016603 [Homalodisca vitripennis]|nr:hypothetical protein J6590_016603 [Homalodisca vitripennis]